MIFTEKIVNLKCLTGCYTGSLKIWEEETLFGRFSVKKPYTVLVGVVLVIVLGIVSFTRMTTDLLPDMSLPYVVVMTTDMGASPEEVEQDITAPIEAAMATTSNIKNVSSTSGDSYSMVVLEYEQDTGMDSIIIEIQQALDQLQGRFPDTAGTPIIMQIDPDMMPIMIASADVAGMNQSELSVYVTEKLVPAIESIEGVASVSATGVLEEEIQITLDQEKIDALNEQIMEKIDAQFADAQKELEDGAKKIEDGKAELEAGIEAFAQKTAEGNNEIINGKIEVYKTAGDINEKLTQLKAGQEQIDKGLSELQTLRGVYVSALDEAAMQRAGVPFAELDTQTKEEIESQVMPEVNARTGKYYRHLSEIDAEIAVLSEVSVKVNAGLATIQSAQDKITEGKVSLNEALITLNKTQIQTILQMSNAYTELAVAASRITMGQTQLDAAKEQAESSADLTKILTADALSGLLAAQNFSMPAGYITEGNEQYLIRVGDEIASVEELKNTVLLDFGMEGMEPIKVSDVALVEITDNSGESYSKVNGNPAIMLSIEKQTGYSTGNVTDSVLERFELLESENADLRLGVMMNQGIYIDMIIQSVLDNMIWGAVLAIIVLILFLKDFRPTIVIACSIPLSVIFAIVLMYFSDISLNIISLSGLALGIGMLVDNSIVVIENIYRFRSEGYSIKKAAVEGASEVTGAIIGSTLTTVCVFAPIIFTEGITRQLFVDIALTIAFTLTASLVVAMTFVPMMAAAALKKTKEVKHSFLNKIVEGYGWLLEKALKWKALVFLAVIGLLVVSMKASLSKGFTFMDMNMESNQLSVTVSAKEDEVLSFEELTGYADAVIETISAIEGVDTIGAMAGGGGMLSMAGTEEIVSMYITLKEETEVTLDEVVAQIKEQTKDMGCLVSAETASNDMTAMLGSGISVRISGRDMEMLQELAAEVTKTVENVEGTVDVENGLDNSTASFTISVDKEKAAEYGMTVAQVFQLVYGKTASASAATMISTDLSDYEVYVQGEAQAEVTLADIRELKFTYTDRLTGEAKEAALSDIAEFKEGRAMDTIQRSGQNRYLSVSAGIDAEHNVTLVSNEIMERIGQLNIPAGYEIKMAGEDEMISESMEQLVLMMLLAVIFIYLIMVAQFQSLLSPFIIMFTIPLAFTGGFAALFFAGEEVSVIAMIGFIMLAGIIVNNGIVLVDYMNQLRRSGKEKKDAIIEAGKTRLRPVLMTALTTILAMSTMAMGVGDGSEMMQPMAIVEVGGLIYGTLLTLFVVPCLYDALNRNKSMAEEEL